MKGLFIRTLTGIIFVALLVAGTLFSPISFGLIYLLLTIFTVNEFLHIVTLNGTVKVSRPIIIVGSCYLLFAFWMIFFTQSSPFILLTPYLLFLLYCFIKELYANDENPIGNLGVIMLSQLYVALPLALINLVAFESFPVFNNQDYPYYALPLAIYIFIWSNDTGAYLLGSAIGKHKLFPRISPKKSWEGFIGGAILTLVASLVMSGAFHFMSIWQWLGMGTVTIVFGTWGDLVESLIKRKLGLKDSGHLLPGHGGLLDRLDSMLLAIPAVVVYFYLLSLF